MANVPERLAELRGSNPTPISMLASYAIVPLAVCMTVTLGVRVALEQWILPKLHGVKYTHQNERNRRGFVQNYLHVIGRVLIIIFAVPALGLILAGHANLQTDYMGYATCGDFLLLAMLLTVGLYFHELMYKLTVSYVTLLHHVGAIGVGSYAIVMAANYGHHGIAHAYFIMANIWGKSTFLPTHRNLT